MTNTRDVKVAPAIQSRVSATTMFTRIALLLLLSGLHPSFSLAGNNYMYLLDTHAYTPVRWGNTDPPTLISVPFQTVDPTFNLLSNGAPSPSFYTPNQVDPIIEYAAGAWNGISRVQLVHDVSSPPDLGTALETLRHWNLTCDVKDPIVAAVDADFLAGITYR